jgi:predicted nucleotidyltransferase
MPLPNFNSEGDMPVGVHAATMEEIVARLGTGTAPRQNVTARLQRIYHLARATGKLERFVIFGSYVTDKPDPNDVDVILIVILIMRDDFKWNECDDTTRTLFEHKQATEEFGASIFWMRPSPLILEGVDEFIAHWQIKRDQTRRGIVEVQE